MGVGARGWGSNHSAHNNSPNLLSTYSLPGSVINTFQMSYSNLTMAISFSFYNAPQY